MHKHATPRPRPRPRPRLGGAAGPVAHGWRRGCLAARGCRAAQRCSHAACTRRARTTHSDGRRRASKRARAAATICAGSTTPCVASPSVNSTICGGTRELFCATAACRAEGDGAEKACVRLMRVTAAATKWAAGRVLSSPTAACAFVLGWRITPLKHDVPRDMVPTIERRQQRRAALAWAAARWCAVSTGGRGVAWPGGRSGSESGRGTVGHELPGVAGARPSSAIPLSMPPHRSVCSRALI